MEDTKKRIICNSYKTLYQRCREICENKYSATFNDRMVYLIQSYVDNKLSLEDIQSGFSEEKEKLARAEKKDAKISLRVEESLYKQLVEKLKADKNTRPATFISLIIGYFIFINDSPTLERELYAIEAQKRLEASDDSIEHVVFGLRYKFFNEKNNVWEFLTEKLFIHECTEEEYQKIYVPKEKKKDKEIPAQTPLFDILAKHKEP